MKREIKFRGKDIIVDDWVYGCLIYILDPHKKEDVIDRAYIKEPLGIIGEIFEVDPSTVGQFTGLKDKNGKEIYEGDVVLYDDGTEAVVTFLSGCFVGYDRNASSSDDAYLRLEPEETPFFSTDFKIEITGTIHD